VNKDLNDVAHRLVFSLLGGGIHVEEEFGSCIRVNGLLSLGKRVNDSKFCPSFYSQDFLWFDSLSRDWILKLDPNDNFRN
jgi:hypothetical protein